MKQKISIMYYENRNFRWLLKLLVITIASVFYGVGIACFIDSNNMATGGMSGISIILNRVIPIQTGTWYLILNIPIVIYGFMKFGKKLMFATFYCIVTTTIFTNLSADYIGRLTDDRMLACLVGGAMVGASMGFIFKVGATTGGSDIISKALRNKYQHIRTGVIFAAMDTLVVLFSGFIFNEMEAMLYGLISAIVTSWVFDLVLYYRDGGKLLYIISDNGTDITKRLLLELDVGVTNLYGKGAFSGKEKEVIMVVIKKVSVPKAEAIIREEDPDAFTIISDASEIYGLGYKSIFSDKL